MFPRTFLIFASFWPLTAASFDPHFCLIFSHFSSFNPHFCSFFLIFASFDPHFPHFCLWRLLIRSSPEVALNFLIRSSFFLIRSSGDASFVPLQRCRNCEIQSNFDDFSDFLRPDFACISSFLPHFSSFAPLRLLWQNVEILFHPDLKLRFE